MGDFNPYITAECDGGSHVTVDVMAPWNIYKVDVTLTSEGKAAVFTVEHPVDFNLVSGPWWTQNEAVTTHVPGDSAAVSAIFYEIDSEGHVFEHPKGAKEVVAVPATDCATTTTQQPERATTTTTGVVPPPPPSTIGRTQPPPVHRTVAVQSPPTLPATGVDVGTVYIGAAAVGFLGLGLVCHLISKWGRDG